MKCTLPDLWVESPATLWMEQLGVESQMTRPVIDEWCITFILGSFDILKTLKIVKLHQTRSKNT